MKLVKALLDVPEILTSVFGIWYFVFCIGILFGIAVMARLSKTIRRQISEVGKSPPRRTWNIAVFGTFGKVCVFDGWKYLVRYLEL